MDDANGIFMHYPNERAGEYREQEGQVKADVYYLLSWRHGVEIST